ncbi:PRC-barrel domain-containing protein [Microlunatus parietis]|uniref:Sporulation protein YlmC with PRC-barrel domain n=1 Tax=Microlunatus parietis TaxID=682979 RepID=A0A7Y9I9N7_9ACTN|nr:PRC-barrel domain-containing protein [Microlunatus parietis]NYE72911.1 sporulation protein YlmC with PRC-barrel domain [Microlunatus parietis]
MMENAHSATLVRLKDTDLVVGDDQVDVRGMDVVDRSGAEVGDVDGLLVDEAERKVRFLQVGSGGFLGLGEKKQLIPVEAIVEVGDGRVKIDQDREQVAGAPVYDPDLVPAPQPDYYEGVYGYYGYAPFWTPGYTYQGYPRQI